MRKSSREVARRILPTAYFNVIMQINVCRKRGLPVRPRCNGCMHIKGPESRCSFCGWLETDQNGYHQLPVGTMLNDQYWIGRALGQGGVGITYLGWDTKLAIPVAIKEYYPSHQVTRTQGTTVTVTMRENTHTFEEGKDRFLKEARTLAKLRSQHHIVQVYNFFSENNTAYIVMEYIEGITLQEHIRHKGGKLTVEETFSIMQPIFRVMEQVHEAGMIHRDISPDNIMIQKSGSVRILDFGTARDVDMEAGQLTHSTQAVLKRGFAPPEQYTNGREIDQRADMYALCGTIYYCLTGNRPLDALNRLLDRTEIPWAEIPGLTAKQEVALKKGTALQVKDRFSNLCELEKELFQEPEEKVIKQSLEIPAKPVQQTEEEGTILLSQQKKDKEPKEEKTSYLSGSRQKKKPKRRLWLPAAAIVLAVLGVGIWRGTLESRYNHAQSAHDLRDFDAAYSEFAALGSYKDSKEMLTEVQYQKAHSLMSFENYDEACAEFEALGEYKDSERMLIEAKYRKAVLLEYKKEYRQAYKIFKELGNFRESEPSARSLIKELVQPDSVAAGVDYTVAINSKGTVLAAGNNEFGRCNVYGWSSVVAVAAGASHTIGLNTDGTVLATGSNNMAQCMVSPWENIVAVDAGLYHTVGLRADGTVTAVGLGENGQCDVSRFENVKAVAAGGYHTVVLHEDGTVSAEGDNTYGQCDVSSWKNIVAIAAGEHHTVGLEYDGSVVAVGSNKLYQCSVAAWQSITAISAGKHHTVGLKTDGTMVVVGDNNNGQCELSQWNDIVAVDAGWEHTVGLKADGAMVIAGKTLHGQGNVTGWKNIRIPD